MSTSIAQRGRSRYGKPVNPVVAKECPHIGPGRPGSQDRNESAAIVYLDANGRVQAVPVRRPSRYRVAGRVVQEPDIAWRRAGAASDRCRAAREIQGAGLELNVNAVGIAVLECGRRRNAESMHSVIAEEGP